LPKHHKVVLVQGCFWHGHSCRLASHPKSNQAYWSHKIASTQERDRRARSELEAAGWSVLELWECEIRAGTGLIERIVEFMRVQPHR
jgi:DNA mismatch endonuclease (patch repair protein)